MAPVVPRFGDVQPQQRPAPGVRANVGIGGAQAAGLGGLGAGIARLGAGISRNEDEAAAAVERERERAHRIAGEEFLTAAKLRASKELRGDGEAPGFAGLDHETQLSGYGGVIEDYKAFLDEGIAALPEGAREYARLKSNAVYADFEADVGAMVASATQQRAELAQNRKMEADRLSISEGVRNERLLSPASPGGAVLRFDQAINVAVDEALEMSGIYDAGVPEEVIDQERRSLRSDFATRAILDLSNPALPGHSYTKARDLLEHARAAGHLLPEVITGLEARVMPGAQKEIDQEQAYEILERNLPRVDVEREGDAFTRSHVSPAKAIAAAVAEAEAAGASPGVIAEIRAARKGLEAEWGALQDSMVEDIEAAVRDGTLSLDDARESPMWQDLDSKRRNNLDERLTGLAADAADYFYTELFSADMALSLADFRAKYQSDQQIQMAYAQAPANFRTAALGRLSGSGSLERARQFAGDVLKPPKEGDPEAVDSRRWATTMDWIADMDAKGTPPDSNEVRSFVGKLMRSEYEKIATSSVDQILYRDMSQDDILATVTYLSQTSPMMLEEVDLDNDANRVIRGTFKNLVERGAVMAGATVRDAVDPNAIPLGLLPDDEKIRATRQLLQESTYITSDDVLRRVLRNLGSGGSRLQALEGGGPSEAGPGIRYLNLARDGIVY